MHVLFEHALNMFTKNGNLLTLMIDVCMFGRGDFLVAAFRIASQLRLQEEESVNSLVAPNKAFLT